MMRWPGWLDPRNLWPRSLQGQLLLAVALALLAAQGISATLLYRAQAERREATLVHAVALRLVGALRRAEAQPIDGEHPADVERAVRKAQVEFTPISPLRPQESRNSHIEHELLEILREQGIAADNVQAVQRPVEEDPRLHRRFERRAKIIGHPPPPDAKYLLTAVALHRGGWLVARVPVPGGERQLLLTLLGQTLLAYALLVGAIALILGRITRPLAQLTRRLEQFADTRDAGGQIEPHGPMDIQHLILAHNAMEARIAGLLDEKDVMLGAIGHDLKTPLAALRVRIESVENETERARMAATIEDITRSLDDILSLARVGRPSDPIETVELSALVAQVAEEFEDMGEPVDYPGGERIVLPLRPTWLRRALRNLVSNALRYGQRADIAVTREAGMAVITIDDQGPGIPEADLERMLEPFTRGDPSRNSATGGAGLGLTLARAIADQHGGSLTLTNRRNGDGNIVGLCAALRLPV